MVASIRGNIPVTIPYRLRFERPFQLGNKFFGVQAVTCSDSGLQQTPLEINIGRVNDESRYRFGLSDRSSTRLGQFVCS